MVPYRDSWPRIVLTDARGAIRDKVQAGSSNIMLVMPGGWYRIENHGLHRPYR